jgi:hypothetical protein
MADSPCPHATTDLGAYPLEKSELKHEDILVKTD